MKAANGRYLRRNLEIKYMPEMEISGKVEDGIAVLIDIEWYLTMGGITQTKLIIRRLRWENKFAPRSLFYFAYSS